MVRFIQSVKGKIIIASILACIALFMAWETSKDASRAVLYAFENISAPNEKLRLVNELSHRIARLDQVQKGFLFRNPSNNYGFLAETKKLSLKIDTLKRLYVDNRTQVKRLNTLKKLLQDRDRLYISYLNVRNGLINNKSFSAQVGQLNAMVNKTALQTDSLVTTTEKKTSTTMVYPAQDEQEKEEHKGFFNKLFGKKEEKAPQAHPYRVVNEETKVQQDTIAVSLRDSLLKAVGKAMKKMEKRQQTQSALFVKRERVLNKASGNIIKQILTILNKVQNEAIVQNNLDNTIAKGVVRKSITRISFIMLLFFILTGLLVYFILRDISRINIYRKKLEAAKDEAEYHALAKHRFLSNMSHEIRTPLQSIIGYAELLKKQDYPQKKDINAIYTSSNHLLQIVNEVLDYNRIISGKFTFVNEVFNMQALLDEVVTTLNFDAEKKGIEINKKFDEMVSNFVKGDPFRLKQVLYNLMGNAIKFTHRGEVKLTVRCTQTNDHILYHFDVTDTGIGLAPNDIERIFNEFEQAGNEKQQQTGTGLGLAITKKLIESQGGNINVNSQLGIGSSFIFELGFEAAVAPTAITVQANTGLNSLFNDAVWVVDDDPFILEVCARMLGQNGIGYRCFLSANEMLAAPWDYNVKCVMIDMRMPEMDGMELCRLLRKKVPADTRLYALTAQVMPEERTYVLEQGFNGLLMKPFKEKELIELIKQNNNQPKSSDIHTLINMKAIERMTFGDTAETAKILIRFANDSFNDIDELCSMINEKQANNILLITHRIAGRTAQAGATELSKKFRMAEMELYKDEILTQKWTRHILELADELHHLATVAEQYTRAIIL